MVEQGMKYGQTWSTIVEKWSNNGQKMVQNCLGYDTCVCAQTQVRRCLPGMLLVL